MLPSCMKEFNIYNFNLVIITVDSTRGNKSIFLWTFILKIESFLGKLIMR